MPQERTRQEMVEKIDVGTCNFNKTLKVVVWRNKAAIILIINMCSCAANLQSPLGISPAPKQ